MWKRAAAAAVAGDDPWEEFDMGSIAVERIVVHRFVGDAKALLGADGELTGLPDWTSEASCARMESEPFAQGAQRECYRIKILAPKEGGEASAISLWSSEATNYVAKRYMDTVASAFIGVGESRSDRLALVGDVRLQSAAEVWAQSFNTELDPPKKVDMLSAFLVEFVERAERPIFVVEAHMAGGYVKYNTNAGFVEGLDWSNDFEPGSTALMQRSARLRSASLAAEEDASDALRSPGSWMPGAFLSRLLRALPVLHTNARSLYTLQITPRATHPRTAAISAHHPRALQRDVRRPVVRRARSSPSRRRANRGGCVALRKSRSAGER